MSRRRPVIYYQTAPPSSRRQLRPGDVFLDRDYQFYVRRGRWIFGRWVRISVPTIIQEGQK